MEQNSRQKMPKHLHSKTGVLQLTRNFLILICEDQILHKFANAGQKKYSAGLARVHAYKKKHGSSRSLTFHIS